MASLVFLLFFVGWLLNRPAGSLRLFGREIPTHLFTTEVSDDHVKALHQRVIDEWATQHGFAGCVPEELEQAFTVEYESMLYNCLIPWGDDTLRFSANNEFVQVEHQRGLCDLSMFSGYTWTTFFTRDISWMEISRSGQSIPMFLLNILIFTAIGSGLDGAAGARSYEIPVFTALGFFVPIIRYFLLRKAYVTLALRDGFQISAYVPMSDADELRTRFLSVMAPTHNETAPIEDKHYEGVDPDGMEAHLSLGNNVIQLITKPVIRCCTLTCNDPCQPNVSNE